MATSASFRSSIAPPQAEFSAPRVSECLSDDDILAFAEGRLDTQKLPALHGHMDHCEPCQQLIMEAVRAYGSARTQPSEGEIGSEWNTTFRRGSLIGGRYLIQRFIARGGMGEVYEALDRELMERVALKTVTSTACDSQSAVRRLKAEVQLARRVSHPNVCRIYDFGTHTFDTGVQVHFLTMEFVEGETLGQRLRLGGPLALAEATDIARLLLRALSAAHAAGILHRDFKSDNVMLRAEEDGTSTPLILDFGLARALDDTLPPGASGSNRHVVGTFGYMAPEQLQGKPLTVASDLYSFGIVCFEMLTAELPQPNAISVALPAPFSALIQGCLRPAPGERFKSTDEALACLDAAPRRGARSQRARLAELGVVAALVATVALAATRVPTPGKSSTEATSSKEESVQTTVGAASPQALQAATTTPARHELAAAPSSSQPAEVAVQRTTPRRSVRTSMAPRATAPQPAASGSLAPAPSSVGGVGADAGAPAKKLRDYGWENPFAKKKSPAGDRITAP